MEQKVGTGSQVWTVGWMIGLLEAHSLQSNLGTVGLIYQSVAVVEEDTTGQLAPPLLTYRFPHATKYSGVLLPVIGDPHVLEDGGHDLASQWLGPKSERCRRSIVFPGHALELCLLVPMVNPHFITCHDSQLKSRWVFIVQNQQFLRSCVALKVIMHINIQGAQRGETSFMPM